MSLMPSNFPSEPWETGRGKGSGVRNCSRLVAIYLVVFHQRRPYVDMTPAGLHKIFYGDRCPLFHHNYIRQYTAARIKYIKSESYNYFDSLRKFHKSSGGCLKKLTGRRGRAGGAGGGARFEQWRKSATRSSQMKCCNGDYKCCSRSRHNIRQELKNETFSDGSRLAMC
ncbi:hypothetical protein EVAR_4403_1 [Eumeta japonica]|uniref:Uncharacterized protein n=1 Tax=Eumeta variegata TaxID=151549 RepID=A0A4C1SXN7_EUMVA|nr:hypothetical protein EVAR_4403_1 [Eumeta japonica]